jgi:hypothetical protein
MSRNVISDPVFATAHLTQRQWSIDSIRDNSEVFHI